MILADLDLDRATLVATDIDVNALEKARLGIYPGKIVKNVSEARLERYLRPVGTSYQIKDQLKKMVTFKKHDLINEQLPVGACDLIVCRNVIIYFTEQAKNALYQRVIRSLRIGGCLFAGNTEQIFQPERLGLAAAGGQFFYKKSDG
jgi:chemotaxis protein methyltransferase CheR